MASASHPLSCVVKSQKAPYALAPFFPSQSDQDERCRIARDHCHSSFTLYLPRTAAAQTPDVAVCASSTDVAEDGHGRRVLVVEDNADVGSFSTQLLEDLGYRTVWAANGAEALATLSEQSGGFDLVFTDVIMPGISGIELGQTIRRDYPAMPVVLTSGYSHVLAEEGRYGFELLSKPYSADELSMVLSKVLRDRAME